jgi:hypothetical protein
MSEVNMDTQSSATMNLEQLQQLISSQVQQHTTPLHNQVRDLENTNQQLRTLVSQLQVGQNIGQQYNNELGGRLKAAKPKTYNGSIGSDPDVWLFQFNQYSDIAGVPVNTRAKLAATYLEGKAATWWRNLVMQTVDHNADNITWEAFQNELINMFKPVNSKKIARDKLAMLKQTNSVAKYNFDFTQLCLEINDVSESEKLDKYIRGLKDRIRVEVELAEPTALAQAMSKAQRIDNITYQSRMAHNNAYTPDAFNRDSNAMDLSVISGNDGIQHGEALNAIRNRSGYQNKGEFKNNNTQPKSRQFTPLQRLSQEEFSYCQRNRLCLKCKEPGHTARYCNKPVKPLNLKAQ